MLKKKKIYIAGFFVLFLLLFGGGCGNSASQNSQAKPPEAEIIINAPDEEPQEEDHLPIGLYIKTGSDKRVLQDRVQTDYVVGRDLVVLSAFLTEAAEISGSKFSTVWLSYKENVPEAAACKIGYQLSYTLASGESIAQTIKMPVDTEQNREYIETYIYDDVHQSGWYSHLLESEVTEETVATSIKLTGGPKVEEVGDISVEAFLYKVGEGSPVYGRTIVDIIKM